MRSPAGSIAIISGSTDSEHFLKSTSRVCVRPVCELRQTRTHSAHKKRKRPPMEDA